MDSQFTFKIDSTGLGDVLDGVGGERDKEGSVQDGVPLVSGVRNERFKIP